MAQPQQQELPPFPLDKFNDVLVQTKKVKQKLAPFIAQFQKHNIQWIFEMFRYLKMYLTKPKENIVYKFNSLYVIKVLFDTSDYILVNWIQIFFLPTIIKIASASINQPAQDRGKDYFLNLGYTAQAQPQIEKFGYNYTIVALELLQIAAQVKPNRLYQNQFIEQPSDYFRAFQQIKKKGYVPPQKLVIYAKPQVIATQIQTFAKNCQKLSQQFLQKYEVFSQAKLYEYLQSQHRNDQQKYQISIVQVFESGDLFISSAAMQICKGEVSQPQQLITLKNSIEIVHRMMLSADYQTFFILNFQDTLTNIITQILNCDKADKSLKRGKKFFSSFQNPDYSNQLYILILDMLQKWANFASGYCQQSQNYLSKIVTALKSKVKLAFPQPTNLNAEKQLYLKSREKNKSRNSRLAQQIQKKQSQLIQVLQLIQKYAKENTTSEQKIQTSIKKQPKKQEFQDSKSLNQTPAGDQNGSFMKKINHVEQVCKVFLSDKQNYAKNRKILQQFNATFQQELQNIPDDQFDSTFQKASYLSEHITKLLKKADSQQNVQQKDQAGQPISTVPIVNTKKIQSQTYIQNVPKQVSNNKKQQASTKNLSVEVKQSIKKSKQNNLDTPVKKIQMEQSQKNNQVLKKVPEREEFRNKAAEKESNKKSERQSFDFSQIPQQSSFQAPSKKNIQIAKTQSRNNIQKLGYENEVIKTDLKKQQKINNQDLGYANPKKNIESVHENSMKNSIPKDNVQQQIPSIKQLPPNQDKLGYNRPQIQQQNQKFNHPQNLGYQVPKQNQSVHRSIRKTQNLSASRKDFQQSSFSSSGSKVQPFVIQNDNSNDNNLGYQEDFKKKQAPKVLEQQIVQLNQDIEQNLSINKPKQFKSLGRYKLQSGKNLSSRVIQSINQNKQSQYNQFQQNDYKIHEKPLFQKTNKPSQQQQHYQSGVIPSNRRLSQYGSRQKLQQQIYAHQKDQKQLQQQDLLQDYMNAPNIDPMQQSFHDIQQIQQKIKQTNSNNLSFKNCFQADKYILTQDKKSKLFWLQNDTNNLIKTFSRKERRSRVSKINVPEILQERNRKFHEQLKTVEQQKNKKIKDLQNQIKNLKNQTETMKDQIIYQKEQIKTLKAYSQFDKQSHSNGQRGYLLDMENIAAQKFNSPNKLGYANKGLLFDTTNFKDSFYLDPKGKLINSKTFKQYFEQFKKQKQKKGLLKSKDLLYKDKQIQVGCMTKKENDRLIVTFYITPERDIESLSWTISNSEELFISSEPNQQIPFVRTRKQQKVFLTIEIRNLPFYLPQITFHYKINQESRNVKLTVPCCFHKFIHIKQGDQYLNEYFNKSDNVIRGEQVPYSKKILKNFDSLKQYFQSISLLNKGQPNAQGQISYGGIAYYQNKQYPIRISIKPNQFLYVQGSASYKKNEYNNDPQAVTTIQYYISLITFLLMKQIQ